MKSVLAFSLIVLVLAGCKMKTKSSDDDTVITTHEKGLVCDDVHVKINKEIVERRSFYYGEKIYVYLNNVEGFTIINKKALPFMEMTIISPKGDTLDSYSKTFEDIKDLTENGTVSLDAYFTAAYPHNSSDNYTLLLRIKDKKGDGELDFSMPFKIIENDYIGLEVSNMTYNEVYLWDEDQKKVVVDNDVYTDTEYLVFFEGLEGFTEEDGKVYPEMMIKLLDANGDVIVEVENAYIKETLAGVSATEFNGQAVAVITIDNPNLKSPLQLTIEVSDSKSNARIELNTDLNLIR